MTDMPPTRFRVVERGRRLEVIDTQAKRPSAPTPQKPLDLASLPTGAVDRAKAGDRTWLPTKIRFDGGLVWTTRRFYDAKGPRTLTLNAGTVGQLRMAAGILIAAFIGWLILASFVPALLGLPLLLASGKTRETLRSAVTDWIDRLQSTP
ncbi:hypothetical protein ACQKJZ_11935 [Sphingomonas sp. NPDC019816]|uniref:hypothetical protein n=1 Tax=Sphingomonas sp. NPDC019816 TaxID=3390679 RepID=UPI003D072A1A